MATIKTLNIYPMDSFYAQQRSFASFKTTSSVSNFHVKLNIPTQDNSMWMIEAVGYNYGSGQSIRTSWVWYSYVASGGVSYQGYANIYPGMTAASVYNSSDGYVCLRADFSNTYFTGFTLNAYCNREGGCRQVNALAYTFISSTSNQY